MQLKGLDNTTAGGGLEKSVEMVTRLRENMTGSSESQKQQLVDRTYI